MQPNQFLLTTAARRFKKASIEREQVFAYLSSKIESANMAASDLEITRPNMCRHVRKLQQLKKLRVVGYGICKITGRKVQFITSIRNLLITRTDEIKKA